MFSFLCPLFPHCSFFIFHFFNVFTFLHFISFHFLLFALFIFSYFLSGSSSGSQNLIRPPAREIDSDRYITICIYAHLLWEGFSSDLFSVLTLSSFIWLYFRIFLNVCVYLCVHECMCVTTCTLFPSMKHLCISASTHVSTCACLLFMHSLINPLLHHPSLISSSPLPSEDDENVENRELQEGEVEKDESWPPLDGKYDPLGT